MTAGVWTGLAHIGEIAGTGALDSRPGAYVNVLAWASGCDDFIGKATRALEEEGLEIREIEEVEPLASLIEHEHLSVDFLALADYVKRSRTVAFDTMFRYETD